MFVRFHTKFEYSPMEKGSWLLPKPRKPLQSLLVSCPMIQQKIEFQDVLLIK